MFSSLIIKRRLILLLVLTLLLLSVQMGHAQVEEFTTILAADGSAIFDALDPNGTNGLVRTFDKTSYEIKVIRSDEPNYDSELLLTAALGSFDLPATYTNDPNIPALTAVEKYTYESMVPVTGGCERPIQGQPAAGNPSKNSYVAADGKTLYCYLPVGQTVSMHIDSWVLATAPNGAVIHPPIYTVTANGTTYTPQVPLSQNITVVAKPTWDARKYVNWKNVQMISGSGPNGEDGYIFTFHVGIYDHGSRKGVEMLKSPITLVDNFSNTAFPNARVVTWPIDNYWLAPAKSGNPPVAIKPLNTNGFCSGVANTYTMTGNALDHSFFYVRDLERTMTTAEYNSMSRYTVANGGDCAITSFDDAAKTFTMQISGTDMTLSHYPERQGYDAAAKYLVSKSELDSPDNEWWVADKWFMIWAPKTDIPLDMTNPITETFTNTIQIDPTQTFSITGQPNNDIDPADNTASYDAKRVSQVVFDKMSSGWKWGNPYNWLTVFTDPNVTSDGVINQIIPNQYMSSYIHIANDGSEVIQNGILCEKIDNTRKTYVDTTATNFGNKVGYDDKLNGTINYFISGNIGFIQGYKTQVGVDKTPAIGNSWDTFNNVTNEYVDPLTSGSEQADAQCGDDDAIWYDSLADFYAAGRSLQEISRVRVKFDSMVPGVNLLFFVPLKTRETYAFDGVDILADGTQVPFKAGDSIMNSFIPNQATIQADNLALKKDSDAVKVVGREWAKITKTSDTHPDDPAHPDVYPMVAPMTQIRYNLQVNLTSNDFAHMTNASVWDVIPKYATFIPGTSYFGNVPLDPALCTKDSSVLPKDIFPTGIPEGFTACRWDLRDQQVVRQPYGNAQGNIPLLTFRVFVDSDAPSGKVLYNTAFADAEKNDLAKAYYVNDELGFRCYLNQNCSREDHASIVNLDTIFLHQKFESAPVVPLETPFYYTLFYGSRNAVTANVRILDILPFNGNINRVPPSKYNGTLKLSAFLEAPVAAENSAFAVSADPAAMFYYTKQLPVVNGTIMINRNPYAATQCLYSGVGSCAAGTVAFCQQTDFGDAAGVCPASLNDVTAFMVEPLAGGILPQNAYYEVKVPLTPTGNKSGDLYSNDFTFAVSPSVAGYSNVAKVYVYLPDPSLSKVIDRSSATSNDVVTYAIRVRNGTYAGTGPIGAGRVLTVTDTLPAGLKLESVTGSGWVCTPNAANPDTAFTCTYTVPIESPVVSGGGVGGVITVKARVAIGTPATATGWPLKNNACVSIAGIVDPVPGNNCGSANLNITASNSMTVQKVELPPEPPKDYEVGDTIRYNIELQNTGNGTLTNVTLTDDLAALDPTTCTPAPTGGVWTLTPAQTIVCPASYVVTQDDLDAGSFINTATGDSAETPPTRDDVEVPFTVTPVMTISKTEVINDPFVPYEVGDTVQYQIVARNTGNVTLTEVTIADEAGVDPLVCEKDFPATIPVGGEINCTASHVVTQTEFDAGLYVNTASGTSKETGKVTDSETVHYTTRPLMTLRKLEVLTEPPTEYQVGDSISYSIVATNAGNVTLTNVKISDPLLGDGLTCDKAAPVTLGVRETLTCTGTYKITQADLDHGSVHNTATGTSDETDPVPDEHTTFFSPHPLTQIAKTAMTPNPVIPYKAGDEIRYSVVVENVGNVTLTDVTVTDPGAESISCNVNLPATLEPQGRINCVAIHIATEAEIKAGTYTNVATVDSEETDPQADDETVTFKKDFPGTGFPAAKMTLLPPMPAGFKYRNLGNYTLEIPVVDLAVNLVGVPYVNGQWEVAWLGDQAGVLAGLALPGEGVSIITAHNHIDDGTAGPFALLRNLAVNDRLFVTSPDGKFTEYAVVDSAAYPADHMEAIYEKAKDNALVLITCEDELPEGGYQNRRVIFAMPRN